jgi:hypothetical protein
MLNRGVMRIDLETENTAPYTPDEAHARLAKLVGDWTGNAKTWMDPDPSKPPVEAKWEGRIALVLGGRFARFTYRSSVDGKPFAGDLTLAYEAGEKLWRSAWIDSFHSGGGIIYSTGNGAPNAKPVTMNAKYFAAEGHPHWGWRTEIHDGGASEFTIRMFNIMPDGEEMLGVEIVLKRA